MTAGETRTTGKQRFYEAALSEAERQDLTAAMDVVGFEQEIATLRLRLRSALQHHPEDLQLMLRGYGRAAQDGRLQVRALAPWPNGALVLRGGDPAPDSGAGRGRR